VIFFAGRDDSHFLSLILIVDKRKKSDLYTLMKDFLDKYVTVSDIGVTDFGSAPQKLVYTDVENQSQEFQDALRNLVKYGILSPRSLFDGERPLTWEEYIRLYVWSIYHKRLNDHIISDDAESPTFDTLLKKISLDRRAYVNTDQRDNFSLIFSLYLAGVSLPSYTEVSLDQFKTLKDTKYHAEWQKIEDFEYLYFKGQKMSPNGSSYYNSGFYTPRSYTFYNPVTGLSHEPILSADPIKFGVYEPTEKARKALEAELECTRTSVKYFSSYCFQKRQEYFSSLLSYEVLTK